MKDDKHKVVLLEKVSKFIGSLSTREQAKIAAHVEAWRTGDLGNTYIKTLKTPIRELIVRPYRLVFFVIRNTTYFVGIFRKKTAKTPKNEIQQAERIYKQTKIQNKNPK